MKRVAIIVAGGKGLRMGGELPKQFRRICHRPILMLTIEAFHQFDSETDIILVLSKDQQLYWQELCKNENFTIPYKIADGGESRYESVKNGLELVEGDCLVAVHDGVRPFISQALIQRCFEGAERHGAILPAVPVIETLRLINSAESSKTVDRSLYRLVQTPQVFQSFILKRAYCQTFRNEFTDDASVVESLGLSVAIVEGERENIKITTPFDLSVAECLMKQWTF